MLLARHAGYVHLIDNKKDILARPGKEGRAILTATKAGT